MSDTVKLIIEMSKDIYDGLMNNRGVVIPSYWHEYVADLCKNSTPLDDVKAEIRARVFDIQATSDKYFDGVDDVMDIVDEIIDKHIGKAESEDT